MKTINFITSHFLPENTACTNRVLSYVNELKYTYKINIIALAEKGIKVQDEILKYDKNITIYYINQINFDGKKFFKRALYEIYHINKLINLSHNIKSDLTITTTPYMFMIPLIGYRIKGEKILDIRDMVWEYLDSKSFVKKTIKYTLTTIMKYSLKKFDKIFVTNTYEYQLLENNYYISNVDIVANGISRERYNQLSQIKTNENNIFTITYVGNIGLAQNIQTIIDSAKVLSHINFVIIGDGIEKEELQRNAHNANIKNLTFTGKLAWHELASYYANSSILYAQLDENYISAMPSKLYEYATIGLPIIYGGIGEAKLFIEKLENARCIEPNNSNTLIQTIQSMEKDLVKNSDYNRNLIKKSFLREDSIKIVSNFINNTFERKKSSYK